MKKSIAKNFFLGVVVTLFSAFTMVAQNSVSGKVVDSSGESLPGANVIIKGSSQGTTTDFEGNFNLATDQLPTVILVSYTGFKTQEITIDSSDANVSITLEDDFASLDEVIISASRRSEKVIDAVAAVSLISTRNVESAPVSGDVVNLMRNLPGLSLVQNGAGESNVELRGSAIVNETNTLVMKDYLPLTTPYNKRVNTAAIPLTPIDIASVEVVRGPAGALYGPNVTSGVVHYITKDPFKYTGVDVYTGFGNQGQSQVAVRWANHSSNDKFGYKLIFKQNKVDEFQLNDRGILKANGDLAIRPGSVKTLTDGSTLTVGDNLLTETYSTSYEATLIYNFNENTSLTYVGSINDYRQNFRNQNNHLYNGGRNFLNQLRFNSGNFFATFFASKEFGSESLPGKVFSFNYSSADETNVDTSDSFYYDITAQYNLDLAENTTAVIGGDVKIIPAFSDAKRYGVFSDNNASSIYGAYVSLKHDFSDKLSANFAGRFDTYDAYDQSVFSPRLGFVYKTNDVTAFRLSLNRSYSAESQLRTFLDFTLGLPPALPRTHAIGVGTPVTYNNPETRFAFGTVDGGNSYELADIIAALATNAGVNVDVSGVSGSVTPGFRSATFQAPLIGRPIGPINSLNDVGSGEPELRAVNTLEFGFTTVLNSKLKITADAYYSVTQNIQPQGIVPLSAGAQLDFAAVSAQINTALSGTVAQPIIDQLTTALGTSAPGPPRPGYGLIVSDIAQARGYLVDVGFPTYGNEDVKYFGLDLGLNYSFTNDFTVFGNYSYVSENIWTPEDLGETNPSYEFFLNTPNNRFNFGINYLPAEKFYGTFGLNHLSEFDGKMGDGRIFTGTNKARTFSNMSLGYRFKTKKENKLDLGLSINNLFDAEFEQFVNLPTIRRTFLFTLKYNSNK